VSDAIPRVIVFDLGKVIVDFSVEKACQQLSEVAGGVGPDLVRSFLFDEGLEYRFEVGEFSFRDFHGFFEQRFKLSMNLNALKNAASDIFTPNEGTLTILRQLRENSRDDTQIVLLSNTNEAHWEFIDNAWGISKFFHHKVLSYEVKALKPEEKIYKNVLQLTGCKAEDCFFVDDLQANVDGARKVGFDAVLFSTCENLRQDLKMRGICI
jgi:glucose-1-phosphatase